MKLESIFKICLKEQEDYRGDHRSPGSNDSPLYDVTLTDVYSQDIYTSDKALRYYGSRYSYDAQVLSIIRSYHNKPDRPIRIYRAIPIGITNEEKIDKYERDIKYIMKYDKIPSDVKNWGVVSEYYEYMVDEIEMLKKLPPEAEIGINDHDWVGLSPEYARDHGERQFGENKYKIVNKVVPSKHVFTDGNSLQEWGYDSGSE